MDDVAGLPGVGALPAAAYLPAFVGTAAVSLSVTAVATAVSRGDFDMERLRTEVRRLGATADGGGEP